MTNTARIIYIKAGVTPCWMCGLFVSMLPFVLATSNASLDCTGAEMAFRVLYVCIGDSAFVESESTFIHYSEVSLNGRVLLRLRIRSYTACECCEYDSRHVMMKAPAFHQHIRLLV